VRKKNLCKGSAVACGNLSKQIPTNKGSAVAYGNLSKQDPDRTTDRLYDSTGRFTLVQESLKGL
jgi:hypothetical protein